MIGSMKYRRDSAMSKVRKAIADHNGCTILSAGITSIVPGITALAAVEAGVRMIEISQNGVALDYGFMGVKDRRRAIRVSHLLPTEWMVQKVEGMRNVLGDDVFIAVGTPGLWTQPGPARFDDDLGLALARAGADGLHTHFSTLEDLEEATKIAHRCGLVVDAYICP